jgi:hypothetical protein
MTLGSVFWLSFITVASGMILKLASLCFKSKCRECELCGGRIRVIRDVEVEEKEREFELTHKQTSNLEEK